MKKRNKTKIFHCNYILCFSTIMVNFSIFVAKNIEFMALILMLFNTTSSNVEQRNSIYFIAHVVVIVVTHGFNGKINSYI